tara:strand:- start:1164 stop:1541 length:378 start_codon:yes stop_codon:yes gene_type:complete
MNLSNEKFVLQALRGANTCEENSSESIEKAVRCLLGELVKRNNLKPEQIVSLTFSVTKDLDACFPASIARQENGWGKIALLDCQQMFVKGDLKNCIRLLAHTWLPVYQDPKHVYLGNATMLRPDR